ncbi:cytochrome P450 [Gigaspora rosea]|uniref:Cytochrome P450 n=1 Tax=Gigaspora rosea TaxID=44941 RepID=A0A397W031_9GLOM|nr:cytochrome P450 [Gigaspora rosea]
MAYVEIFCLLLFIISIFHLIKRPRICVNEPPLVPYRIPIIGHTYYFLNNTKTFLKECREKYGEPFSLYIFGEVITFAGVDSISEVLNNTATFDFELGVGKQTTPLRPILKQFFGNNLPPHINQLAREMSSKANSSNVQKELLFEIEKFFGNCKEPKVFRNIHDTLIRIMAKLTINLALGKECAQSEVLVSTFAELANITLRMKYVTPILSFIHSSFHGYFVSLPLKNAINRHKTIFIQRCKPIVEERILQRKKLGEKYIQKLNELELDFVDDKFMGYFFIHVYLLTANATAKHLTSALFDYGGRPELWKEIYEEQLKIHNESNGNLSIDVNKNGQIGLLSGLPHMVIADSYTFSNRTTVPRGRIVYLYMKDTNFNNKFYGETSDDFQPKRQITSYSDGKIVHSSATKIDNSFMVFRGGKHACPGRFYAVNIIKIFLHESILRYNIRTESGKIEPPKISLVFLAHLNLD